MTRIAIFLSGRGSNMEILCKRIQAGDLDVELAYVASDNPEAGGLAKAASLGIETKCYPYRSDGRQASEKRMIEDIEAEQIDWIILAGFMRILSPEFVSRYRGKIVNIHPSLLPSFPGTDAIGQAWRYGVKITGVTVHLVDEMVDHGTILAQEAITIKTDDRIEALESRIHEVEHRIYWKTLNDLFAGKIHFSERR